MTHTLVIIIIGIVFFVLGPYLDRDRRPGTYRAAILYGTIAAYLYFILVITILGRPAEDIPQTELVPLVSWYHVVFNIDRWYYVRENMLKILLFIQLGLLAGAIWKIRAWCSLRQPAASDAFSNGRPALKNGRPKYYSTVLLT